METVTKMQVQLLRPRRLMALDYGPDVPMDVLRALETAGRDLGLPLNQIELLGQDARVARGFVTAHAQGHGEVFLDEAVDWEPLEEKRDGRTPIWN